jgi:HSP20 family molecular chaperone IbpA
MNTQTRNLTPRHTTEVETQREVQWVAPPVDIYENGDQFLIVADVPGATKETIRLDYERGRIDFEARPGVQPPEGATLVVGEQPFRSYRRSFSIPGTIDVDKISAELKEGVLTLRLPKSERAKPRQIQVRAS